jgi:hypothetical protein
MKIFISIFFMISSFAYGSTQDELESLKKRIEELENQQDQLLMSATEPKPQVNSFLRDNFTLGGFFDGGYNFITGPDTETQGVNDGNALGLNISAVYGSNFKFVSQIVAATNAPLGNKENNPLSSPEQREYNNYMVLGAVTQGYVEYSMKRSFNVQAGLGYVPFGFALQLREPVLYVRRGGPQLVRNGSLISIFWQGLHLYGVKDTPQGEIGYNLYTFTPTQNAKLPGVGSRFWMASEDEKIIGGLNAQLVEKDNETLTNVGTDFRFDFNPFQIRTEFIHKFTQNTDSWTGYIEPGMYFYDEEFLIYIFGDYFYGAQNEVQVSGSMIPDPIQKWEYGVGLNWLPTAYTRFRFGVTFHDYVGYRAVVENQNRDYLSSDFSVGVAF